MPTCGVVRPEVSASSSTTAARAFLLLVCALLGVVGASRHPLALTVSLVVLLLLGVVGARPVSAPVLRLLTLVESFVWAGGVLLTGADLSPMLPYLLAPALAAGVSLGLEAMLIPVGSAAVAVLAASPGVVTRSDRLGAVIAGTGQWVALALMVGLLGSWVQRLQQRTDAVDSYRLAYRLLAQLRTVTRRMPAGLDRTAVAEALVREVQGALPAATGLALYLRRDRDQLTLLAHSGEAPSEAGIREDPVASDAWLTQIPTRGVGNLVLPLVVDNRTMGLLLVTIAEPQAPSDLAGVMATVREGALRLDTALIFDEVREVATREERKRLAREIHDGVAQDLAAFGYALDGLAYEVSQDLTPEQVETELRRIRAMLGLLIVELRHSIFELRTDVGETTSLGAALSAYARGVSRASGLSIHLSLEEGPTRLAADTESELLRIAQEAVNNARKHAQASNLWVRCQVSPPLALVVVEDDGIGTSEALGGGFGVEIMQERAQRLGAAFTIAERQPRGTIVTCRLGDDKNET